jgi:hypothetical protein
MEFEWKCEKEKKNDFFSVLKVFVYCHGREVGNTCAICSWWISKSEGEGGNNEISKKEKKFLFRKI